MVKYLKDFFPLHREKGAYSGNPRNLKAEFNDYVEPDPDDPEAWLKEERFEDDFKKHVKDWMEPQWKGIDFSKRKYFICGQSHIDVAWKWRYWQTFRKAIVTYKKAVWHAKNVKNYAFAASQPVLLDWIRHEDPKLFEDIKAAVKAGSFDLVGGMWVEPDCHLPSGEAFCRQRLYGQRFYLEHFGKTSDVEWVPDSFGFASTLPQILLKSGSHYFHTTKLCGNSYSQFPFVNFLWESPDGSQVFAYLSPGGYGSMSRHEKFDPTRRLLKPGKKLRADYSVDKPEAMDVYSDDIPEIGMSIGKGDGGHGPTGEEVAIMELLVEQGKAAWMNVTDYFTKVMEKYRSRLPVWTDELYYEYHRGTLTTHLLVKRMNRYLEWKLCTYEKLVSAIAAVKGIDSTPWMDKLRESWKLLALNQFHDVLPGSSIPEVYDDVYDFWEYAKNNMEDVRIEAWNALLGKKSASKPSKELPMDENTVLFNSTGFDIKDVLAEISFFGKTVPKTATVNGETVPVQLVEADSFGLDPLFVSRPRRMLLKLSAPQHSFNLIMYAGNAKLSRDGIAKAETAKDDVLLENELYAIKMSKASGNVTSILFKPLKQELLATPGIQLNAYFDWHVSEQAWNISPGYRTMGIDLPPPSRVSIVESGPVRWTVEIEREIFNDGSEAKENGKSKVLQRVSIIKDAPGIYIEFLIDWHTCECTAKLDFQLASMGDQITSEVPYGTIKRKANPTANHDVPRWENYNQTWVDVPSKDAKYGIAFINNGRYGHDTKDNRIGLTLIRGPFYPTAAGEAWVNKERQDRFKATKDHQPEHSDLGPQLIRYIVVPHEGSWEKSTPFIPAIAHWFNDGHTSMPIPAGFKLEIANSKLAWTDGTNAEIGAIKGAEDKVGIIFRVVESSGFGGKVSIHLHQVWKFKSVVETDILERPLGKQDVKLEKDASGLITGISYAAKPHEIKTFLAKI
nr:glycoside hydrolase family 38 C-terminal domain-containing protein [Candidatus Sigynarchaeota archaeon]